MKEYKNGDLCPCCGQVIQGKSAEWLTLFSVSVDLLGLADRPVPESGTGDKEGQHAD